MPEISTPEKLHRIHEWLGTGSVNFFGLPFAGKDTQAEHLGRVFDVPVISSGHILRTADLAPEVRAQIDSGDLGPTEQFREIVLPYFYRPEFQNKPLLLSSVGRMSGEEQPVIEAAHDSGHTIRAVPYLKMPEGESFRRLAGQPDRGRADDTPTKLRKRLDEFYEKTQPVLETYERAGLLIPINAMQPEDVVFRCVVNELYDRVRA